MDRAAREGQDARVIALTAGVAELLRRDGPWADAVARHQAAVAGARRLGDQAGRAGVLSDLGTIRRLTDDLARAIGSSVDEAGVLAGLGRCVRAAGRPRHPTFPGPPGWVSRQSAGAELAF